MVIQCLLNTMGVLSQDNRKPNRPILNVNPDGGKPHTGTVIIMHGLGDNPNGFADVAQMLSKAHPHLKFIVPCAPHIPVTINGGAICTAWLDLNMRGLGGPEMLNVITQKPRHLDHSILEIMRLVEREAQEFKIPPSRCVLMGFSLGGMLAAWAGLQSRVQLGGIVMLSTMIPGAAFLKLSEEGRNTPLIYYHGQADPMVPAIGAQMSKQQLENWGCALKEFREFPGLAHSLNEEEIGCISSFLGKWLSAIAAPEDECAGLELPKILPEGGLDLCRIPDDAVVRIRGLKGAPEHNGCDGTVVGFDVLKGRFSVLLGEKPVGLKPQNLTQRVPGVSLVAGAEAGKEGVLEDFDDETGQFVVRIGKDQWVSVKPDEMRLPIYTVVRVHSLQSEKGAQMNEKLARIDGFDEGEGRYVVNFGIMENGEAARMKLKPSNLNP